MLAFELITRKVYLVGIKIWIVTWIIMPSWQYQEINWHIRSQYLIQPNKPPPLNNRVGTNLTHCHKVAMKPFCNTPTPYPSNPATLCWVYGFKIYPRLCGIFYVNIHQKIRMWHLVKFISICIYKILKFHIIL